LNLKQFMAQPHCNKVGDRHCFHTTCKKMDITNEVCSHENVKFCFEPYKVCCQCPKEINVKSKGLWDKSKGTKKFWRGNEN